MASVTGDDNGVIATCDEANAACDDCEWEEDGSGQDVIDKAEAHVDETGHHVSISGTYYGSVEP